MNSIGRAELESVFNSWERRSSECIQMKSEYIAYGESKILGENPDSHRQTETLKNNRTSYTFTTGGASSYFRPCCSHFVL
jgi:hypothetical protein